MVAVGSLVEEGIEKVEHVAIVSIVFGFVLLVLLKGFEPLGMKSILGHLL